MIRFGLSGWRGVVADEITVASVRHLAAAAARHLRERGRARAGVFVGHDARFLSPRFAREMADVLAAHGLPVVLSSGPLPTPAAAHATAAGRRALGMYVTAGHLPPECSGVTLFGPDGAPAPAETLRGVETQARAAPPGAAPARGRRARTAVRLLDARPSYLRRLARSLRARGGRRARLRLGCDARGGASAGWLDLALGAIGRPVESLNGAPHPDFAGQSPDCGEAQTRPLARCVRRGRLNLGVATDGDGDRFALIDHGGVWIPPNQALALLADYLIAERGFAGGLARTVATTHLLDAVAALHGRALRETPVGFAHLAPHLRSGEAFLSCEENGGLALASHLPQRDGLLAGLLAAEMVAARRRTLRDQARALFARVGPAHGRRIDYHVDPATRDRVRRRLEEQPEDFGGRRVRRIDTLDGCKMIFGDGSWILIRPSGSEPMIRCHIETRSPRDLELLTAAARALITKG